MTHAVRGACLGLVCVLTVVGCGAFSASSETSRVPNARPTASQLHRVAIALAARGDLIRAEQYASLAVAQGLPLQRVLPLMVSVCLRASRVSAALVHAQEGLREAPDDHRLRYLVASIYVALGRTEDALRELDRVLTADPGHLAAAHLAVELRETTP